MSGTVFVLRFHSDEGFRFFFDFVSVTALMATTDTLSYSIELALLFPGWGYLELPYLTAAFPRLSRLRGTLSLAHLSRSSLSDME